MTEKEVVTPEWLYCPYSSPRQSLSRGPWYLKVFGFPIKDFGNDGRGGFPECLYYPLFVTPEWFYCPYSSPRQFLSRGPWYLKVFGFPIKDFGNDEKGGHHP